jgi:hypothetical protein
MNQALYAHMNNKRKMKKKKKKKKSEYTHYTIGQEIVSVKGQVVNGLGFWV